MKKLDNTKAELKRKFVTEKTLNSFPYFDE